MQCDGRQCAYMTTDTPTITPTVGLAGRGKLRLQAKPTSDRASGVAASSISGLRFELQPHHHALRCESPCIGSAVAVADGSVTRTHQRWRHRRHWR
jgi:hypothetical protein